MVPYIIVHEERIPTWWAVLMQSIHSSEVSLSGAMYSRTFSVSTSAPPPGIESSPALRSSRITSTASIRNVFAKKSTSLGLNPWM